MTKFGELEFVFPGHTSGSDVAQQRTLQNFSFSDSASILSAKMGQTASTVQTPATPQPDAAAPKVITFLLVQ